MSFTSPATVTQEDTNLGSLSRQSSESSSSFGDKISLKRLEDDPYYKKLMSCACEQSEGAGMIPSSFSEETRRSGSGSGPGSTPDSSLSSTYTIGRSDYIDNGNVIDNDYNNRCLIISLAVVLGIKESEWMNFYQNIINNFNQYYSSLADRSADMTGLFNDLQMVKGRRPGEGYIDAGAFFHFIQLCGLNNTGVIFLPPMIPANRQGEYTLTFSQEQAARGQRTNGFYIPPLREDGTLDEITRDTPIIYNQGLFHFVNQMGSPMSEQMFQDIKTYLRPYTNTYTDSKVQIPNANGSCNPVLTEEQKQSIREADFVRSTCPFKIGDFITVRGSNKGVVDGTYLVLEARTTIRGEQQTCGSYIVSTTDDERTIFMMDNDEDHIQKDMERGEPLNLQQVLDFVHENGKNPTITDYNGSLNIPQDTLRQKPAPHIIEEEEEIPKAGGGHSIKKKKYSHKSLSTVKQGTKKRKRNTTKKSQKQKRRRTIKRKRRQ